MNNEVGVFGGGVVGLTTALKLQEQFSDIQVTLIADAFNKDTTSDGAAGLFLPSASFNAGSFELTRRIIEDSYEYYANIMSQYSPKHTGVRELSGYLFSTQFPETVRNPLVEGVLPVYRSATEDELQICSGNIKFGSFITSIQTECRYFLPWALERFQENGGKIVKGKVSNIEDMQAYNFETIFNCMGLGAKPVFKDRTMVPIRGHIVKVSAPWLKQFLYCDNDTYIIPGVDNISLGGIRSYGSYELSPNRFDREAILDRCYQLVPKLSAAPVLREWVGLRPHRDPVRLEVEHVTIKGKKMRIVHNYGHGGYGVTSAPGCAKFVVDLFAKSLSASKL